MKFQVEERWANMSGIRAQIVAVFDGEAEARADANRRHAIESAKPIQWHAIHVEPVARAMEVGTVYVVRNNE